MNPHEKFTKEFAAEAVALLHSCGRRRRQVADILGTGLSTLARWSRDSRDRSASKRQQGDMVMLAHVRSAFSLSNGIYGSLRMTRDLQDDCFAYGRRRTARLMHENGV